MLQVSISYMLRRRKSTRTKVYKCNALICDDTAVPKHVGIWYLSRIVFYDLFYFIECIYDI